MSGIPEKYLDLFDKRSFAHIATIMPDGSPHVTPAWIDLEGEDLLVNTARGRVKERNMRSRKRVAISIQDPENPYRAISIRGRVVEVTEEGADEHVDRQAKKYLGVDRYPYRQPGEVRVLFKVRPEKVAAWG